MEKITITIEMVNAAFEEHGEHNELARILRNLADRFENGQAPTKPMDINGDSCGTVEYE